MARDHRVYADIIGALHTARQYYEKDEAMYFWLITAQDAGLDVEESIMAYYSVRVPPTVRGRLRRTLANDTPNWPETNLATFDHHSEWGKTRPSLRRTAELGIQAPFSCATKDSDCLHVGRFLHEEPVCSLHIGQNAASLRDLE